MKGTQSSDQLIIDYRSKHSSSSQIESLDSGITEEFEILKKSINKHSITVKKEQKNYYINERSNKYHLLALRALQSLSTNELKTIIAETLLTSRRSRINEGEPPRLLSEISSPQIKIIPLDDKKDPLKA